MKKSETRGRKKKKKSGRKLRPLHLPSPVPVRADARGRPAAVGSGRTTESRRAVGPATSSGTREEAEEKAVVQIREVWRIDDEWWREPISRLYFEAVLEDGKRVIVYRDLVDGGWYLQRG